MPCSADGGQIATLPEERTVGREVAAVATRPQGQERNWSGKGGPELGPPNLHYHPLSFLRVHVRVHAGTHVCEGGGQRIALLLFLRSHLLLKFNYPINQLIDKSINL